MKGLQNRWLNGSKICQVAIPCMFSPIFPYVSSYFTYCFPSFIRYFPFFPLVFISVSYFRSYEKSLAKVLEIIFWASSWKKFSATILLLISKPSVLYLRKRVKNCSKSQLNIFMRLILRNFESFHQLRGRVLEQCYLHSSGGTLLKLYNKNSEKSQQLWLMCTTCIKSYFP